MPSPRIPSPRAAFDFIKKKGKGGSAKKSKADRKDLEKEVKRAEMEAEREKKRAKDAAKDAAKLQKQRKKETKEKKATKALKKKLASAEKAKQAAIHQKEMIKQDEEFRTVLEEEHGVESDNVEGDGNCCFRSVARQLGDESSTWFSGSALPGT